MADKSGYPCAPQELPDKLGCIAACEDRTKNGELLRLIRQLAAQLEKARGRIEL